MPPRADGQVLLQVRDLRVDFDDGSKAVHAVRAVSFDIATGETLGIVGDSGSGKSVTALSIMRLLPYPVGRHPTGSILLCGRELIGGDPPTMRLIGGDRCAMIFQEPMSSLNPLLTVKEQSGEVVAVHKRLSRRQARERALELLRLVRIPEPERRPSAYPHELSGGQAQRVTIAMALANEPDLLITDEPTTALDVTIQAEILALRVLVLRPRPLIHDEPTSALDRSVQSQIIDLLRDLPQRYRLAHLFVSHNLKVVRALAEVVIVMRDGRGVEAGPTTEVFSVPGEPYIRRPMRAAIELEVSDDAVAAA